MRFTIKLALQSILNEKWINVLSIMTIGVVLFMLFAVLSAVYNIELMTKSLPEKLTVMVFLKGNTSGDSTKRLEKILQSDPRVKSVKFITKDEALEELKGTFKGGDHVIKGLAENPLFDSFEVKLSSGGSQMEDVKKFISKVRAIKEVDDVEYGESFLTSLYSLKKGLRMLGVSTAVAFTFAIVFICYSTIRILFYRRKDEIEIFKLLGATKNFIRAPFFIEGSVIGLAGGVVGAFMLLLLYRFVFKALLSNVAILSLIEVPPYLVYSLPPFGMTIGLAGAAFALGRLKY
jgi:cell division transport system permease protein